MVAMRWCKFSSRALIRSSLLLSRLNSFWRFTGSSGGSGGCSCSCGGCNSGNSRSSFFLVNHMAKLYKLVLLFKCCLWRGAKVMSFLQKLFMADQKKDDTVSKPADPGKLAGDVFRLTIDAPTSGVERYYFWLIRLLER